MASYESLRSTAYSEDHRWRIVYQRKVLDYSVRLVAENLGVSPAIEKLFDRNQHSVEARVSRRPHNHAKKFTPNDEFLILQLAIDTPGIQLHEIQIELPCSTGTCVITSRLLYKSGFTRKKLQTVALQRSEELRQKFVQEMTVYNRDMFAFLYLPRYFTVGSQLFSVYTGRQEPNIDNHSS